MPTAEIRDVNEAEVEVSSTIKRRKGLGVRVIGCRIYDSENGKTCHQCRQKTMDLMASCKNASGSRPCSQHFCSKCLLNRYGEKVTEVSQISLWSCPRCRGVCNCSICLKKQGRVPTGILVHAAKATGCTSVAELLKKCSAGGVDQVKVPLSPLNDDFNKDENVIQDAQLNGERLLV
ncbi:hypothetical protein KP509_11G034500 [Ceratopteris richardii]|uniref:Zinc-finger domain-containing protein n=1 Tax=Ceratopteris richardii TaxID=49495 RepID=A0A8T2TWU4_CERRI|nr:hypothetical protein KP509_11G034400 [Ceratopteris richardii]KAH7424969.1 hypothetical protein KP509_11G034500 [Ceratopteris richardii]